MENADFQDQPVNKSKLIIVIAAIVIIISLIIVFAVLRQAPVSEEQIVYQETTSDLLEDGLSEAFLELDEIDFSVTEP